MTERKLNWSNIRYAYGWLALWATLTFGLFQYAKPEGNFAQQLFLSVVMAALFCIMARLAWVVFWELWSVARLVLRDWFTTEVGIDQAEDMKLELDQLLDRATERERLLAEALEEIESEEVARLRQRVIDLEAEVDHHE